MDETLEVAGAPFSGAAGRPGAGWGRLFLAAAVLLGFSLFGGPLPAGAEGADEPGRKVVLNADRVSYNDETGRASAEGRAVLNYEGATIRAERIEYDAHSQKVQAMPLPGEKVVLQAGDKSLAGDRLDYDLETKEGVLSGAGTSLPVGAGTLYVHGKEIEVLPWDRAVERGLVHGRPGRPDEYLAEWRNVVLTTCALDHPHYRIESKTISFVPGRSVVAKRPRLYLGNTYVFTSPMDYVVRIDRRAMKYSIMPYLQSSETRGTGGGVTGSLAWDSGSLSVGVAIWSKVGTEWMAEVEQALGGGFSLRGGVSYSWDELWDETVWRPFASLSFERGGWHAVLNWSRNEYIQEQKDLRDDYKGRLERRPEVEVRSPWFRISPESWVSLSASWGSYREETAALRSDVISRWGAGFRSYYEKSLGTDVDLFSKSRGEAWFYDKGNADQQMLWSLTGLRYRIGVLELATAYEHRYVWGEGAMLWDRYRERERLHQQLRFPMGREVFGLVRGSYDLEQSEIDKVYYALQWVTDCMKWELNYTDDRSSGGEGRVGLSLSILAFPDTPASFGQEVDEDPFERPRDLPDRK